ncbi:MAG TPA: hypothetical protein VF211_10485 [Burkholderiales bacterium]
MRQPPVLPLEPRPSGAGAFFDYARLVAREQLRRDTARPHTRAQYLSRAEQRWEGEGGYTPA